MAFQVKRQTLRALGLASVPDFGADVLDDVENGQGNPTLGMIIALARALKVEPTQLCAGVIVENEEETRAELSLSYLRVLRNVSSNTADSERPRLVSHKMPGNILFHAQSVLCILSVITMAATRSARILIVDDHEVVRAGLALLLKVRWTICGEAVDGKDAVEKVRELRPDVVVLDVSMPRRGGVAAAQEIRHFWPETKIIFYSMHDGGPGSTTRAAKLAGADAFVSKRQPVTDLIQTIQGVIEDESNQSL